MRKPDWAEEWHEQTFDFGHEQGFAAVVGPFRQAVRHYAQETVREPVYGEEVTKIEYVRCEECEQLHPEVRTYKPVIKPGKYRTVKFSEEDVHPILEDWFKNHAKKCREFLVLAEERGW